LVKRIDAAETVLHSLLEDRLFGMAHGQNSVNACVLPGGETEIEMWSGHKRSRMAGISLLAAISVPRTRRPRRDSDVAAG
jgi:hypothetical protein